MKKLYLIPDVNNIQQSCELAEKYNAAFEYHDFFATDILDNISEIDRIIDIYKALDRDRKLDILHGAFFDIAVFSHDSKVREVSQERIIQSMDIARRLSIKAVVVHTNFIAGFNNKNYIENWLNKNEQFWKQIIKLYPDLTVYMENMFDDTPYLLAELAKRFENYENFNVCFDYAHAFISGTDMEIWVKTLAPYIRHMHINDNDGIKDMHYALSDGDVDWKKFNRFMLDYNIDSSVLIEVNGIEKQTKSISYMIKNNIYPF